MKASLVLALALSLIWAPAQAGDTPDRKAAVIPGTWSAKAISLFNTWGALDSNPGRKATIYSPDRKKAINVDGEKVTITIEGKSFPAEFEGRNNAELGWSPDSRRFFLTWTLNGEMGPWYVYVYETSAQGLTQVEDVQEAARQDFDQLVRHLPVPKEMSQEPERSYWNGIGYCQPNVVGSQWLGGSNELLLAVLVPNTSRCRYMGEFYVYRVAVPGGKILQRYTAREARRKFDHRTLPRILE
jgi:hypothetical protein